MRAGCWLCGLLRAPALLAGLAVVPPTALAQIDVSSQVAVSLSGMVFNRALQAFSSILTVTNFGSTVYAPLVVQVSTGTGAVTVSNAPSAPAAADTFVIPVTLPQGSLVFNESVTQRVGFLNPTRAGFVPAVVAVTGAAAPTGLWLQVSNPPLGLPVSGPSFLVSGTVVGPSLTGVSVNNVGACMSGQSFYLNGVRPDSSVSSFTATAVDVDGGSVTVTVPFVASAKGLSVQATPQCGGLAPLNALFKVGLDTTDGDTIQSLAIDFDGDGVVDQTLTAPTAPVSVSYAYVSPGLYKATFTATTVLGASLSQSMVMNVQTPATAFAPVMATLNLLQSALGAGNAARAGSYFTPASQQRYLNLFQMPGVALSQAAAILATVQPEALTDIFAQGSVTAEIGGVLHNIPLVLVPDSSGIWRVDSW